MDEIVLPDIDTTNPAVLFSALNLCRVYALTTLSGRRLIGQGSPLH